MRSISSTMKRLAAQQVRTRSTPNATASQLPELRDFGTNPGALRALYYAPELSENASALVVVLHGCTQNAAGFDHGTGWSELAKRHGFAVLIPEQSRGNNFNLCFNWYDAADNCRDGAEPLSIRQMIETMVLRHGIDRSRVFVTGLSAGGAMAAVMLATYPEVFAGGAIVAGLPYGSAASIPEAFDRMRGHGGPGGAALAQAVRRASPHQGPWPSVAIWHGTSDVIVDVGNGRAAVEQWRQVHGAGTNPAVVEQSGGLSHRAWRDRSGRIVLEEFLIAGMGHGEPLSTTDDEVRGSPGPYMLDVGISAARHMAATWGLTETVAKVRSPPSIPHTVANDRVAANAGASNVGQVIEDALRAAGLMR